MREISCKKGMVLGIIFLFIGMSIIPTNASVLKIEQTPDAQTKNDECNNNSLGNMEVIWYEYLIRPFKFYDPIPFYSEFYFTEEPNGELNANFSVKCITYSVNYLSFPRISFFRVSIRDGPTNWHRPLENGINETFIKVTGPYTPEICMRLENVKIPMNEGENRTLYVQFNAGGLLNFRIPIVIRPEGFKIIVYAKE